MVFTGFIAVPPNPNNVDTVKTIAVGSGHSAYFAIQTCAQNGATPPTGCNAAGAPQVVPIADVAGGAHLTFKAAVIAFSKEGGLFPFQLSSYFTDGNHGLELIWADGNRTPPAFTGNPGAWPAPGIWSLIPKTSMLAADVSASLRATMLGTSTVVRSGAKLRLTATIVNRGAADAYPGDPADGGLLYQLALPLDELPAVAADGINAVTVAINGVDAGASTLTTAPVGANLIVTIPFASPTLPTNGFKAGDTATIAVDLTLADPLPAAFSAFRAQGRITGHTTDPVVFSDPLGFTAVHPPVTLAVQTNDPSFLDIKDPLSLDIKDRANAPAGFGFRTDESNVRTGTAVALISEAFGNDDDDPTLVPLGQPPVGTPTIAAPRALASSVVGTQISGSSTPAAAHNAIRVELTTTGGAGITQPQCAAFGGSWFWDPIANRCACSAASDPTGAWNCTTLKLPDCANPGAACFTATASAADLTGSAGLPATSSPFEIRPPIATVGSGAVKSHVLVASGTAADGTGGSAAIGATVHVAVAGPNGFTASCDKPATVVTAAVRWSCPFTLQATPACATAPCVLDGTYTATASVLEANGSFGPTATGALVVDTRPTGLSAPVATRNSKQSFTGHKTGDGTEIRLCEQGAPCGAAAALCRVLAAPPDWSCAPSTGLSDGDHAVVAYEVDASGGVSIPSTAAQIRVKTRTAAPIFAAPTAGGTLSAPIRIEGTAEPGATVAVKIDGGASLPSVTADSSGHFFAAGGLLTTGSHFAEATATDFVGNTAQSQRIEFNVALGGKIAGSSFGCSSAGGSGTFGALLLLGLVPLLGRRRSRKGIALAAAVAAGAGAARADGTDLGLDNFRPASGGDGTIGVEGARPLEDGEGSWEARALLVGQSKPLMFVPDGGGEAQSLIRSRVGGWLSGQGHIWGPLSLGVQLPFLVQQSGDLNGVPTNVSGGAVLGGGLGDLRTTMRAAILRQERSGFDLAMQGSLDLPTAKKQSFLGDSSLEGEGLAAAGYRWAFSQRSALDLLGNLYFRFRPERDVLGVKTGDELGLRAGLAWLPGGGPFAPKRVILEIEGAAFLRAGFGDGSVPGEWRGGVSYCAGPMTFDLALGGALSSGIGTPGVRIIGGVGFSPSVCGSNSRGAPVRPPNPVHLTEAAPPAVPAKPETAPVAAPSSGLAEPTAAPIAAAAAASKTGANEVTMLPLPDLPPLPPPKTAKKSKRTVASAELMPSMPALPAVSAMPLPALAPRASLSGDHVEFAKPVSFSGSRLPAKEPTLDGVARLLIAHPEIALVGVSAPDEARAKAVVGYLRKHGVASDRLRPEGRSDAVELRVLRRR